ncbi:MAG TPA: hypothetical protein VGO78_11245, partial [Acidimicrobiales bacterium]|nr:hypothetical protein [Acidimicrobiales bacterium]
PRARAAAAVADVEAPSFEDVTHAIIDRLIRSRQTGWQPAQVQAAADAVDEMVTRQLDLGTEGAVGGAFDNVADHLDFLRASGHGWMGRATAAAARRAGLSNRAARLTARLSASVPPLGGETELWTSALVLRIVDACMRAELASRRPTNRSQDSVTEADLARHLAATARHVLGPPRRGRRWDRLRRWGRRWARARRARPPP